MLITMLIFSCAMLPCRWGYKGKCWPYCKAAKLPKANQADAFPAASCDNMKYLQSCKASCKKHFAGKVEAECTQGGKWNTINTCKRAVCPDAPPKKLKSQQPWKASCKVGGAFTRCLRCVGAFKLNAGSRLGC
jgi:hypothetical protein